MQGFFNRMYQGKNRSDFTPDQLPDNRFSLFFEMLRIRLFKLVQVNLMFLVFLLPSLFFFVSLFLYAITTIGDGGPDPEYAQNILGMFNQTLLFNVPCMGIAGIGLTGMTYVTRNWARDQHAWAFGDFIDSIKTNWKQGLLVGLIDGALLYVMPIAGIFYAQNSPANLLFYFLGWIMVAMLAVLFMVNIYIWPMMITYNLKINQLIRNSLVLALGRLPFSVLFLAGVLIPAAVALLFMGNALLPVVLFYLIIGFSLTSFVLVSYTNATFDRYINPKIEDAPVNMGLRQNDDEEYEYEDETSQE